MSEFFGIAFAAMTSENLALVYMLGMCTYIAVSARVATAAGVGAAVIVVLLVTVPLNNLLYEHVLAPGALSWAGVPSVDLSHLRYLSFIGLIAALVQMLELLIERRFPGLRAALGVYLPLLTVNCAILGASLLMVQRDYGFVHSIAYSLGVGVGWALAIVLFAAIRERLRYSEPPRGLSGLGMSFIVTGFLALAFAGISGIEFR